ncbi:MAG: argininosuccinate synthase [Myxococcota bacterium]|nr:argininosuccinate synthase [Myxococcota bacterium]
MKKYNKIVCAYSGGLDTSVMIPWLKEHYKADIITYTGDLGQGDDLPAIRAKALQTGAAEAVVDDLQERFVEEFVWPSVRASALYEGLYPLHTALGRPLLAQRLVEVALEHGADAIAHGCTAKGNDQVRFEVAAQCLAPQIDVIAPLRTWDLLTREDEIDYAIEHDIDIPITKEKPFSIDENIWGCAIECGEMEDLWCEPPPDAWRMTKDPTTAPAGSIEIILGFREGLPVSFNGTEMGGVQLIKVLNEIAGAYGIGRIDMVENRIVGLKSREVYEAPGATLIHMAHTELERIVMDRETFNYSRRISQDYSNLIYNGLWFGPLRNCFDAFLKESQKFVAGDVRIRISAGLARVTGRRSPHSLYDEGLATYSEGDTFDRTAATGFMRLYGLSYRTFAKIHRG